MSGTGKHATGPTRGRCPRCGAPVLVTPAGELLNPEPHALAVTRPDGTRLTHTEAARAAAGRMAPVGHHPHATGGYGCNPPAQLALFSP